MIRRLFAGSNTCRGYRGYLGGLLPRARTVRAYYIKGGPGIGKSSLMRDIGERFSRDDGLVEFFECSGDPDSLDAVVSHARGVVLMDATAPHARDPVLPGAMDSVVDLGVCLDTNALIHERASIEALGGEISRCYARATRYLKGANAARRDAAQVYADALETEAFSSLRAHLVSLVPQGQAGEERHLLAQAITGKGVLSHLEDALSGRVVSLDLPWGFDAGLLLSPVRTAARAQGTACSVYHDPLNTRELSLVSFADFTIASCVVKDAEKAALPFDAKLLRAQSAAIAFDRAAHDLLLNQAIDSLAQAKEHHDALERIYIDHMDFARWQETRDAVWESITRDCPPVRTKDTPAE